MQYELYYWPGTQGRGEFVRLALEEAGADYVDVARLPARRGGGAKVLAKMMADKSINPPPFAPPFLKAGRMVIAQTANILLFLGEKHGLAPSTTAGRLAVHQLDMTIADLAVEVHDTHHPIAKSLYYEEQKPESIKRARLFRELRMPKFLGYFERILKAQGGAKPFLVGKKVTTADLSLFQMVEGLRYAFPKAMAAEEAKCPLVAAHAARIAARPRIAAYLASPQRLPFDEIGIFRRYPELDG